MDDDRAVSEVVGFILVFSLVLGTISMVYVGGFAGLQDTRDHEQMANAERAFDVLANNIQEISIGKAPSRATEIKLADASLTLDERYEVNVTVDNGSYVAAPRTVTYHGNDDTKIVYENGAVIRQDENGAVMLREPDFVFTEQRTVIRHIRLRGDEQNIGGSTTVLIRAEGNRPRMLFPSATDDMNVSDSTVELQFQTGPQRTAAWKEYFESREQITNCNIQKDVPDLETHQTVTCTVQTDTLAIATTEIDIKMV